MAFPEEVHPDGFAEKSEAILDARTEVRLVVAVTVTVHSTIDAAGWLGKYLEGDGGDTDLARAMLGAFAEVLIPRVNRALSDIAIPRSRSIVARNGTLL
ncbi:MAG: hypothetical protein ACRDY0_02670 [Acidimicrobiales bacterium]